MPQIFNFIRRNLPVRSKFRVGNPKREDQLMYPEDALREGLVNALVHRDYADYRGGISVSIYPDRLEIWNSGEFPEGITPEVLKETHPSLLRNPDIAHIFHLNDYMERIGRGSLMIRESCQKIGLPEPTWKSTHQLGVTLTFWAKKADIVQTQAHPSSKSLLPSGPESGPESGLESRPESGLQNRILSALSLHPLGKRQMMEAVGHKAVSRALNQAVRDLVEAGLIEMTIPEKPQSRLQKYRLTTKSKP